MGKPAVFSVTKPFEMNARLNARLEGLSDISLVVLPVAAIPPAQEIEALKLGEHVADGIISSLTGTLASSTETEEAGGWNWHLAEGITLRP